MNVWSGGTVNFDSNMITTNGPLTAGLREAITSTAADAVIDGRNSTITTNGGGVSLRFDNFGSGGPRPSG